MPLSEYILGKTLCEGSYGVVLEAKRKSDDKIFAIKVVAKESLKTMNIDILNTEIKIHSELPPCKYICQFIEYFETDDAFHLVLEECGVDLFEGVVRVGEGNLIEVDKIHEIFKMICLAIEHCHDNNVVHRDIKAENVMIKDGICRLVDFGWAKYANGTDHHGRVGTPDFMAPERHQEFPADIWSAGMLLYELLYGYIPKNKYGYIKMPIYGHSYQPLVDLLKKMLVVDPQKRYTIKDVLQHPFIKDHKPSST